jgi:drug/metabolite transporter (DMT)-like permease
MSQPERARDRAAELLVLLVIVIWASNFPISKYGIAGLDIFVFNGIRFVVAAGMLGGVIFLRSGGISLQRADWPALLRAGLVGNVLYQVAFIVGLNMTTAGNSAILLATAPLWTIFINARLHGERILSQMWMGMAVSLCGITMIIVGSGRKVEFGSNALLGDIICIAAAMFWALNTNLQKPLLVKFSPLQLAFVMISVGAVGLSLIAIPAGVSLSWGSVHWTYYLAAIASGALSIAAGNVLWSYGVKRLGPGRTAVFGNLIPVLAFIVSYFTLHEELLFIQIVGAAVTILGVWLARR